MAYTFHGYRLLTEKYAPAYKHMDESEYVGRFRLLSASAEDFGPDDGNSWYGESWKRVFRIKAPAGCSKQTVLEVAKYEFEHSCRCEHDCCGCTRSYVRSVRKAKRREWLVMINFNINC